MNDTRRQIGILLFDGVEELDAVGPWEVLSAWTQQHPEDGWDAFCLSSDGRPVRGAKTLVLGAHHSIDDAPAMDILVHPGGPGTRPMLHDPGYNFNDALLVKGPAFWARLVEKALPQA